jgi:hypothetical protein
VSIKLVTPGPEAANPKHPDHARWVKDRTMKMEAEHAAKLGLSVRAAEQANTRQLERLAARKRFAKIPKAPPAKPEMTRKSLDASGVTRKVAPKAKPRPAASSPCKFCGLCHRCKREKRMWQIMRRANQDDQRALSLKMELTALSLAEQKNIDYRDHLGREIAFSRMTTQHDRNRGVTAGIEWVCDRSVPFMGEWR